MDELKLLIEMVANLPGLALWVLVAFYAYKVIIIGSIYGVIRFAIEKLHSWLTTRKTELVQVELRGTLDGMCITKGGSHLGLIAQLERLRGISIHGGGLTYIHESDVRWLRDAIDAKLQAEAGKK